MQEIETLERKLKFWPRLRNRLLVLGLVTLGTISGAIGAGYVFPGSGGIKTKEVDARLIEEVNLEDKTIALAKAACLEDAVILGEYKKHEKLINRIHRATDVPEYVLAAMIDVAKDRAVRSKSPASYSWPGFVQVTGNEAGLKDSALWDPEQCLLSAAGKYKSILETVKGDEEVALGVFFLGEGTVIMAKTEANRHGRINMDYAQWRKGSDDEDVAFYDALIEKHKSAETEQEQKEILRKIQLHWNSYSPSGMRGNLMDESVYRALTSRGMHELRQWWPENLTIHDGVNGVKVALKLKRDGYATPKEKMVFEAYERD